MGSFLCYNEHLSIVDGYVAYKLTRKQNMKKYTLIVPVILALIIAVPMISRAEDGDSIPYGDDDIASASSSVSVGATSTTPQPPLPKGMRDRLRDGAEDKIENLKNNQETRKNVLLEQEKLTQNRLEVRGEKKDLNDDSRDGILRNGSSTEVRGDIRDAREDGRGEMRNASSSDDRKEIRVEMKHEIFKVKFDSVLRQLNLAMDNIKQIRERILSRIVKSEESGRDMSAARSTLAIADVKFVIAQNAIANLASFTPASKTDSVASTTSDNASSTTPGVRLDRPRQLGDTAIKAVKDAKEALVEVVKMIAKDMGLKSGDKNDDSRGNATSTATTTSTTN